MVLIIRQLAIFYMYNRRPFMRS